MRWVVVPFQRYADFKGRSGRAEFWTFFGLSAAVLILIVMLTGLFAETASTGSSSSIQATGSNASPMGPVIYLIWWFASAVPWVAVQVRRFHDQGRSGWFALIGISGYIALAFGATLVSVILIFMGLCLMALPGEATENRYGHPVDDPAYANGSSVRRQSGSDNAQPPARLLERPGSEGIPVEQRTQLDVRSSMSPWAARASVSKDHAVQSYPSEDVPRDGASSFEDATLPADVTPTGDGRFLCRGITFNSKSSAVSYSRRMLSAGPPLVNANSDKLDDKRPRNVSNDQEEAARQNLSDQYVHSVEPDPAPTDGLQSSEELGGDVWGPYPRRMSHQMLRKKRTGDSAAAATPSIHLNRLSAFRSVGPAVSVV